jgi:hypothetical protein
MEIINSWPLAGQALALVVAFNVVLSGLKSGLDVIKDKTESKIDNKAAELVGKAIGILGKALDFIGYNPAHQKK